MTCGQRLKQVLRRQGRVILGVDGLQPDVGHEVLWVLRNCLSGEILLARSLLSAATDEWRASWRRGGPAVVASQRATHGPGRRTARGRGDAHGLSSALNLYRPNE